MDSLTPYLINIPALMILSVVVTKSAGRFGIPALSIFLLLGMVVGREGPGGVPFSNHLLAQTLGIVALILILHAGGLGTPMEDVRAVRWPALVLSTAGVLVATALVGAFAVWLLHLDWLHGLLLGAAIASTDVAAVFTVLRSRNAGLRGRIRPLLELESALNDPMTVFLSVGLLAVIVHPGSASPARLIPMFFQQMIVGTVVGFAAGHAARWALNWIALEFEGLYPVLSVALVVLTYGVTDTLGGSGFLAVYVSGIVLGNASYVHKRSLTVFHDGLAWLMQIAMFLTMGLLVLPSDLSRLAVSGIGLAAFLVFVARPVSVLLCLTPFRVPLRQQLMVSWAGLRGAVPDGVTLVVEPGRLAVAAAGWYAAEVVDLKRTHGRWFAVLRGGTHHFRLPAAWGYSHPFEVWPVEHWPYEAPRPEVRDVAVDAVGELCTPRDVLTRGQRVNRLRVGDVLVFGDAGAYGWDISHDRFLKHDPPRIVVVP